MKKSEITKLLKVNAYEVYLSSLIGSAPKSVEDRFNEISNPKPGDLVMEITTHWMKSRDPMEGIGRLDRIAHEPICPEEKREEYGYEPDEEIPKIKVWYVNLCFDDGRMFRWTNAAFIKIKEEN